MTSRIKRVVVDTNMIVASPRLNSGSWRALFSAARSGVVTIYVPEVCLIEAEGWMRREADIRLRQFVKAAHQMEHLGVRTFNGDNGIAEVRRLSSEVAEGYDSYLRKRLRDVSTVMDLPDVPHEDLVRRAVDRRLPFQEKGTGYRDALIWESVCHLAAEGPVTLLTSNVKDFGDGSTLAVDLVNDLHGRGTPPEHVSLATSAVDLVQALLPAGFDVRSDVERVLNEGRQIQTLGEQINLAFGQMDSLPYPDDGSLPPVFESPEVEGAWDLDAIRVVDANAVEDESYFVVGEVRATSRIYDIISDSRWRSLTDSERNELDDAWDHGHDTVTVVVYRPVVLVFAGTFTPPANLWNVGVLEVSLVPPDPM